MRLSHLSLFIYCSGVAHAEVTVYGLLGSTTVAPFSTRTGTETGTAAPSQTTTYVTSTDPPKFAGLAAYNPVYYLPPPLPDNPPSGVAISLPNSAAKVIDGLSIPQQGTFFGFSIEMSVATQLIGKKPSILNVQFLNLMSIIAQKGGAVHVRVGGNTQEDAYLVDNLADGRVIEKAKDNAIGPTGTPRLAFTSELIDMLAHVSELVNVKWYLGIPFNDTVNFRFEIAELAEDMLGDTLLGFQAGNEPDLYGPHRRRGDNLAYSQWDYFGEFGLLTQAYMTEAKVTKKNNLIAPSTQGNNWADANGQRPLGPDLVWDTGFLDSYGQFLNALSVEHYPSDNCAVIFPTEGNRPKNPIEQMENLLNHQFTAGLVSPYQRSTMLAQQWGKPFLMFETNTASCGGFPGVSDSFVSALWAVDYSLQLAHGNFTGALFHAGGQNVSYNPFTAAPTNESSFHQWTVGPIFYSAVVVAEALGTTNTSQVKDITPNNNTLTPRYAIYENGNLAKLVLLNFMTDPSGAHDVVATVNVGGSQFEEANATPAQVKVKYLLAQSTAEKDNITWAGQTLGGRLEADGRWKGTEVVQTVPCDQATNTCQIRVPAPGVALVFVSDAAQQAAAPQDPAMTFPTTVLTKTANTVSIDPDVLATSNGMSGRDRGQLGGTSQGGKNGALGSKEGVVAGFSSFCIRLLLT
ncbi:glycoside hydrolase family 79 protein [Daedaleopsis nitida]|nr:glycoside hydrolase family 79 protein [Daedaleopsis nitida]